MKQHPEVPHPVTIRLRQDLVRYENGFRGKVAAVNDWLASHLAIVFGVAWTIWVFFIVPIVAYFLPQGIQNHIFFFSSGWIQLFALPLLVYVGNKVQRSSDAQSDAMHQALTHIANIEDQNAELLKQNTELTVQIHRLVGGAPGNSGVLFLSGGKVTVVYGADATGSNYSHLPKGLFYAGYSTGSGGVAWTAAQWAAHPNAIRICQDPGATDQTADILDVESGAATLADCATWAKAALANFRSAARPGQRSPAIYCSASNVTSVINALIAGGVKSGIGLYVANWNLSREEAAAELGKSSGPWPVVGYQFSDMGAYDLDVWTSSWVNNVSKKGVPPVSAEAPPGQWLDAATWTWADCILVGKGLDGNLHVFTFNPQKGTWQESE